eukprot:s119_g76.t1
MAEPRDPKRFNAIFEGSMVVREWLENVLGLTGMSVHQEVLLHTSVPFGLLPPTELQAHVDLSEPFCRIEAPRLGMVVTPEYKERLVEAMYDMEFDQGLAEPHHFHVVVLTTPSPLDILFEFQRFSEDVRRMTDINIRHSIQLAEIERQR